MTTFWFYKMLMFGYSTLNSLYIIIKWNFNMDPCAKKKQKKKTNKTFRWKIHIKCWYMCCIRHARWSPCVKINGLHMSKPVSGYITREIHFYINRVMYYGVMKCLGGGGGGGGVTILPRTTSTRVNTNAWHSRQMSHTVYRTRWKRTEENFMGRYDNTVNKCFNEHGVINL